MEQKIKSVVGIVIKDNQVLIGRTVNKDDRYLKYTFPGGGVEPNESLRDAVEREVWEETSVKCTSTSKFLDLPSKPFLRFYICYYESGKPLPSNEFMSVGFYEINDILNFPDLYSNNKIILQYCIDNKIIS